MRLRNAKLAGAAAAWTAIYTCPARCAARVLSARFCPAGGGAGPKARMLDASDGQYVLLADDSNVLAAAAKEWCTPGVWVLESGDTLEVHGTNPGGHDLFVSVEEEPQSR